MSVVSFGSYRPYSSSEAHFSSAREILSVPDCVINQQMMETGMDKIFLWWLVF